VSAPVRRDDVTFAGDGWTFKAAPGWVVREGVRRGDYEVVRQAPASQSSVTTDVVYTQGRSGAAILEASKPSFIVDPHCNLIGIVMTQSTDDLFNGAQERFWSDSTLPQVPHQHQLKD
jgi:hypothetical protein